jgi:hypothetical protein
MISRWFAFVSFVHRKDAARAMDKLHKDTDTII